jgi:hypothetical protein
VVEGCKTGVFELLYGCIPSLSMEEGIKTKLEELPESF